MDSNEQTRLQLDYQQTLDQLAALNDIRFKLLALVPALTGFAIALLTESATPATALVVGILGFFVTTGITIYDSRNTNLLGAHRDRAKELQKSLNIPKPATTAYKFFNLQIGHREGLAMIYGATLGAWVFVIANAGLIQATLPNYHFPLVFAIFAGLTFRAAYMEASHFNETKVEPEKSDAPNNREKSKQQPNANESN